MSKLKVMIVGGGWGGYAELVLQVLGGAITEDIQQANLVMFTGGADVSPELYGDMKHPATGNDPYRDARETRIFNICMAQKIPMVGICRGGQFLNVMSGGRMYQHVSKHGISGGHEITDLETGETIFVSSTHHQMMMPSPKGVLVASSALGGEREWYEGQVFKKDVSKEDIEVVYYEHTNALCFQPHPEHNKPEYKRMKEYFKGLVEKFLVREVEHA